MKTQKYRSVYKKPEIVSKDKLEDFDFSYSYSKSLPSSVEKDNQFLNICFDNFINHPRKVKLSFSDKLWNALPTFMRKFINWLKYPVWCALYRHKAVQRQLVKNGFFSGVCKCGRCISHPCFCYYLGPERITSDCKLHNEK